MAAIFDMETEIKKGTWKEDFSSSHINAILWLRDSESTEKIGRAVGRMYVEFTDRKIYLYFNVPYSVFYYWWRTASSKGEYFHRKIRSTQDNIIYEYRGALNTGVGSR